MKHIQIFEEFTELPEGAVKITFKVFSTWEGTSKRFTDEEIDRLKSLASLADAKIEVVNKEKFTIRKSWVQVAFRKSLNNHFALMTANLRPSPPELNYYSSASLDSLITLAIDTLEPKIEWDEIK